MTFEMPPIPGKDDPRWTRRDGIFVPRGEGITKWVIGDTTTVNQRGPDEGRPGCAGEFGPARCRVDRPCPRP